MIKAIKKTSYIMSAGLLVWVTFSYLEITIKCISDPVYSKYNIFVLVFKNLDELLKGGIF